MARLIPKNTEKHDPVISLNLGVNRLGRGRNNDFQINEPSVSLAHCKLVLSADGVIVHDAGSSTGTYVDGVKVKHAKLLPGQVLRLGKLELLVESTDVNIAIPGLLPSTGTSSVVSLGDFLLCARHPETQATYRCTGCLQAYCEECVPHYRRRGGRIVSLCPACKKPCELLCSCRCGARATYRCRKCYDGFCKACIKKLKHSGGKVLALCRHCVQECVLICPHHPEVQATYRCSQCDATICDACAKRSRTGNSPAGRHCPFCGGVCHLLCERHPDSTATHRCTHCGEPLCDTCLRRLRSKSGQIEKFCSLCNHPAQSLDRKEAPKHSLIARLQGALPPALVQKARHKASILRRAKLSPKQ